MPHRIIREGFLDSDMINRLDDASECFYHRLLLAADDAGRFDGRTEILRSRLYPLASSKLKLTDIAKRTEECRLHSLLITYQYDEKPFVQVTKWRRCGKAESSRYPWVDGSHNIEYVKLDTRDGPKEYVLTSVLPADLPSNDPIVTTSAPHAYGVTLETNTNTNTNTSAETSHPVTHAPEKLNGDSAEKKKPHLFRESPYFDPFTLTEKLSDWPEQRVMSYYEDMLSASEAKGLKYLDWSAVAVQWYLRDCKRNRRPP